MIMSDTCVHQAFSFLVFRAYALFDAHNGDTPYSYMDDDHVNYASFGNRSQPARSHARMYARTHARDLAQACVPLHVGPAMVQAPHACPRCMCNSMWCLASCDLYMITPQYRATVISITPRNTGGMMTPRNTGGMMTPRNTGQQPPPPLSAHHGRGLERNDGLHKHPRPLPRVQEGVWRVPRGRLRR